MLSLNPIHNLTQDQRQQAFRTQEWQSNLGDLRATLALGVMYQRGCGCQIDLDKARQLYERVTKSALLPIQLRFTIDETAPDPVRIQWTKDRQTERRGLQQLGKLFLIDHRIKDVAFAVECFKAIAPPKAIRNFFKTLEQSLQISLHDCYAAAILLRDKEWASEMVQTRQYTPPLHLESSIGNIRAMFLKAQMYEHGIDCEKDILQACELYEKIVRISSNNLVHLNFSVSRNGDLEIRIETQREQFVNPQRNAWLQLGKLYLTVPEIKSITKAVECFYRANSLKAIRTICTELAISSDDSFEIATILNDFSWQMDLIESGYVPYLCNPSHFADICEELLEKNREDSIIEILDQLYLKSGGRPDRTYVLPMIDLFEQSILCNFLKLTNVLIDLFDERHLTTKEFEKEPRPIDYAMAYFACSVFGMGKIHNKFPIGDIVIRLLYKSRELNCEKEIYLQPNPSGFYLFHQALSTRFHIASHWMLESDCMEPLTTPVGKNQATAIYFALNVGSVDLVNKIAYKILKKDPKILDCIDFLNKYYFFGDSDRILKIDYLTALGELAFDVIKQLAFKGDSYAQFYFGLSLIRDCHDFIFCRDPVRMHLLIPEIRITVNSVDFPDLANNSDCLFPPDSFFRNPLNLKNWIDPSIAAKAHQLIVAAASSIPSAQMCLAAFYQKSVFGPVNLEAALKWRLQALCKIDSFITKEIQISNLLEIGKILLLQKKFQWARLFFATAHKLESPKKGQLAPSWAHQQVRSIDALFSTYEQSGESAPDHFLLPPDEPILIEYISKLLASSAPIFDISTP